ncbi:MAG: aldehyde ferredoxin oxidoreductase C-terminal domain-containing protein, partial [Anaerolineae bacterium]
NPQVAYAGGRQDFYRSEDGGRNWQRVAGDVFSWGPSGIVAGFPIDILVDPDNPMTLFANNYGGGNVKSTNGGVNWTLASQGYTGALMFDLAVHPSNPALVYATASRGGCHMAGDYYEVIRGRVIPELGMDLLDRHEQSVDVARMAASTIDYRSFTNSAILCHFEDVQVDNLVALLQAITGWEVDYATIGHLGERITNFKRLLNFRLGATRADDRLPKLLQQRIAEGGTEGFVPDIEYLLDLYYRVREWDPVTGYPLPEKLESLDLAEWMPALADQQAAA